MDKAAITLPTQVIGRVDVGRLLREVEALDNFMTQAAIREPGTAVKMPKTSRLLDEMVTNNKLNMLHDTDRSRLQQFLVTVKAKAPVLHMSFSADPSPNFLAKLMTWMRAELHPLVLLQVGLQPNIGAGVIVRTTNKHFDFSLRQRFKKQRALLVERLHAMSDAHTPVVATPQATAPVAPPATPTPEAPAQAVPAVQVTPAQQTPAAAPRTSPPAPITAAESAEELARQVEEALKSLTPPTPPEAAS